MKNSLRKSNTDLDLSSLSEIVSAGAAAGMVIAGFAGKKSNVGGIIGAGLSLLISGILVALDDTKPNKRFANE